MNEGIREWAHESLAEREQHRAEAKQTTTDFAQSILGLVKRAAIAEEQHRELEAQLRWEHDQALTTFQSMRQLNLAAQEEKRELMADVAALREAIRSHEETWVGDTRSHEGCVVILAADGVTPILVKPNPGADLLEAHAAEVARLQGEIERLKCRCNPPVHYPACKAVGDPRPYGPGEETEY